MNGFARAAAGREHREQSLQFVCVKPQAVAARTAVESQWQVSGRAGDGDFVESPVTSGAEVLRAARDNAPLLLELEQGIVRVGSRGCHELVEFASVKPNAAATLAVINLDRFEI